MSWVQDTYDIAAKDHCQWAAEVGAAVPRGGGRAVAPTAEEGEYPSIPLGDDWGERHERLRPDDAGRSRSLWCRRRDLNPYALTGISS